MKRELEELDIRELDAIVCSAPWFTYARYLLLCKLAALGRESFLSGVRTSLVSLPDRERLISKIAAMYGLVKVAKSISAAPSAKGANQDIAAASDIEAASGVAAPSGAAPSGAATSGAATSGAAASGVAAPSGETGSRDGSLSGKEALSFGLLDVEFIEGGAFERHPYVVGGDYFSKADIDSLENKQENISLNYLKGAGGATSGGSATPGSGAMQGSGATPGSAAMQGSGSAAEGSATPGSGAVAEGGAIAKDESSGEISLEIDSPLCTETLASIYAQQGYYQQAIEIYSKLCLLYPEKSAYFATLVKEVKIKKTE